MSPQEGKHMTRKRRRADSHETLVISISSDSDDSHFASLKKKKMKTGNPQPNGRRFDLNLLPEENPQSEVGENSHRMPFFCSCPPTAVSSEWGRSTARFNGVEKWLRMPASIEELEDTAFSKLSTVERLDLNIPAEEVFLSSDSQDSDLASSDSSSGSGDSHHASSDRYSDSGDSRLAPLKEKRGDAQPNEIREIQDQSDF